MDSLPSELYTAERFEPDAAGDKKGRGVANWLKRTGTNAIMNTVFDPLRWTVPGFLPEGLSILAGRQKLGKTWLAIDWALAVACGGFAMGNVECEAGDVVYHDLENGLRRVQRRIETIFPHPATRPDLSRLEWVTEAPPLDKGLIAGLDEWRRSVARPRLVVIDVLQRVKPAGNAGRNAYENDYAALAELQQWATGHGIAVLALHHTRKGGADDPLEALTGSNGLSACADTTLVLDRDSNGVTLYVRGRDIEERETALLLSGGLWTIQGEAAEVRRSDERGTILAVLEEADEPMSPKDIMAAAELTNRNALDILLYKMGKAGEVERIGRGLYGIPGKVPSPGKNGKTERLEDDGEAYRSASRGRDDD